MGAQARTVDVIVLKAPALSLSLERLLRYSYIETCSLSMAFRKYRSLLIDVYVDVGVGVTVTVNSAPGLT